MIYREKQRPQNRRRDAFTLMEMLVVVAIIVALAGIGGYHVMNQLRASQMDTARLQCTTIKKAVQTWHIRGKSGVPTMEQLITDGCLEKDIKTTNTWGKEYRIEINGNDVVVTTEGPNGEQLSSSMNTANNPAGK